MPVGSDDADEMDAIASSKKQSVSDWILPSSQKQAPCYSEAPHSFGLIHMYLLLHFCIALAEQWR